MEKQDSLRVPILRFLSNKTLPQILDGIEAMEEGEKKERLTNLYLDELEARQEGTPLVQDINNAIEELNIKKTLDDIYDKPQNQIKE